jgi:YetA-like protein/TAT (twin-arginine translocation) pathway signal sequence
MSNLSRRDFVKSTAAAAAALQLPNVLLSSAGAAPALQKPGPLSLHWLEGVPALSTGTTFGVPWPRGTMKAAQLFALQTERGESVPVQTWPLAYWPDGSLKWSAHAIGTDTGLVEKLTLSPGTPSLPKKIVIVKDSAAAINVDTGVIQCVVSKTGGSVFESISRGATPVARRGQLVAMCDDSPDFLQGAVKREKFFSVLTKASVESSGPVRVVVKIEGAHRSEAGRSLLPFVVRLYFHAGAESVRMMHSFVFDGDEEKDFLSGLGVRFEVPMRDAMHDRHVRFAGENGGLWGEAVRNLTGLRRDPGAAVKNAQVAGVACPPENTFPDTVGRRLELIPAWGDYTLAQHSADGFQIRKRTKPGHGWIDAAWGHRSPGVGYIGGVTGGVAFGLRDFWQRHPTQLDIRGAAGDAAEVTLWLWSPDAPAMDLRFYHDGMGMETHPQELEGLEITYEDYEKGWGSAYGIARSSEITLWALAATPARGRFVQIAEAVRMPPMLVAEPVNYLSAQVFGGLWSLPDRSNPAKAAIEDHLDWSFDFYKKQVEQRHWYGFWHYGDVRHTYDPDRHEWRYDVGGFAWDNSELSPDLWLYYSFLRTGRADIFRLAEAMTRHTGEVDVFHAGRFTGLGTRHGVQHWGDSAKQVRISNAAYRRFYYYLTADERVGDLLRELLDADAKLDAVDPVRKISGPKPTDYPARVSVGTDWSTLAGAWLTEWERGGNPKYRDKLLGGMKDIGAAQHGFFSGDRFGYEPETGKLHDVMHGKVSASHLSAVFGMVEVCAELIQLVNDPAFEKAWLQYCDLYNAGRDAQQKALGAPLEKLALEQAHSRLTAYASWKGKKPQLAQRAWGEFYGKKPGPEPKTTRIEGPAVLNPIDEAAWVSTNDTAQWGLAAIQNLALIGDSIPAHPR